MFSKKYAKPKATAIIVAAGDSRRMGQGVNKQFLLIDGIPVLAHTLEKFDKAETIGNIIIVTKPENIPTVWDMIKEFGIRKVTDIVPGGATRQQSVMNGLRLVENDALVAVHDGARPFVSPQLIDRLCETGQEFGAVVPGVIPKDTVKVLDKTGTVANTPDRDTLRCIQTPQVFKTDILKLAYIRAEEATFTGTDDGSVVEFSGVPVTITDGENTNIKVTTPEDLLIAEAICQFLKNNY
ncbi:MAG: 2-C-methyl-D-erythritol 4-phosphate cytidylyltransferase [Ruminococcaceae bacterium]|nr:2-C-methyl-D-erythritol 4-phosphate cytidylyltransferase [Oscillospiraceae bacterium]